MVFVAVSSDVGASNIHVLEPRVKINGACYRNAILRQMLLPDIRAVTRLLNVLLASGISVYVLAFVLEADILSTCCNKDDVM